MYLGLDKGIALVTAASRGIGRATAERLAMEGMTVVVAARSVGTEREDLGEGHIVPIEADLGDAAATATLVDTVVEQYGSLDVAVLNTPGPPIVSALGTSCRIGRKLMTCCCARSSSSGSRQHDRCKRSVAARSS